MDGDKAGFGSEEAASMGGDARAKALSPAQRSEIARAAVRARWKKAGKVVEDLPRATHQGELRISNLQCAVLEDGTRVLSRVGFLKAIGRTGKAKGGRKYDEESKTPVFLTAANLKPFISQELLDNSRVIPFIPLSGGTALGYRADLLPQICKVFLEARRKDALLPNQKHIAAQCEILAEGLAQVGITALVDEATGYQDVRPRDALARQLEQFVASEIRKWVKTFPPEFYEQLFRLRGLPYPPENGLKPRYIGHLTNDIVYSRLAPLVLEELKRKSPADEKGYRKNKLHQWLTGDFGHPLLKDHLVSVTSLMSVSDSWEEFYKFLEKRHKKYQDMPLWKASGADPE